MKLFLGSYPTAIVKQAKWPAGIVPLNGCRERKTVLVPGKRASRPSGLTWARYRWGVFPEPSLKRWLWKLAPGRGMLWLRATPTPLTVRTAEASSCFRELVSEAADPS